MRHTRTTKSWHSSYIQYGAQMTGVSDSSVLFEPTRSWNRSTSTNRAVFLRTRSPIVHTLNYYFVVMYVRNRYIIYFHPICSLHPFFSILLTYKHPGSQSRLFNSLSACGLCLGFILREDFSPSLRPLLLGGPSSRFILYCIYCGNHRLIHREILWLAQELWY